jgi:cellulose synthase/poly-beta-1,6-N-acetylglucosamine synthase-like glycosyltransferase
LAEGRQLCRRSPHKCTLAIADEYDKSWCRVAEFEVLDFSGQTLDGKVATGPKETFRGDRGSKQAIPAKSFILPTIPTSPQLLEAIRRMTPGEAQVAFRHRVLPISWAPGKTGYVAAGERAKAYAKEHGLEVTAVANERMMLHDLQRGQENELSQNALWGLKTRFPMHSAAQPFTAQQALWLVFALAFVAFALMWDHEPSLVVAFTAMLGLFALLGGFHIWCILPAKLPPAPVSKVVPDAELPVYSVFVPLFREAKIVEQTVAALRALDYPAAKLDIKLIVEAEDKALHKGLEDMRLPSHMEVIAVPRLEPQTKPRALSYALPFARGELLAVYDADDVPAADQLRRIAGAFALAPKTIACLQTQLGYYNRNESWLARQGAIEYAFQFKLLFPRLAQFGAPLLFAGASSHYRTATLRHVGGFDPHNVARDSGLSLRLARFGFRTALFPSSTREEAITRLRDWMAQRIRWTRGALQTAVVNSRSPLRMYRELGARSFLMTQIVTSGALIAVLAHPLFLLWVASSVALLLLDLPVPGRLWLFLQSLYMLVAAFAFLAAMAAAVRTRLFLGRGAWIITILTLPAYWLLISLASWVAVLQYFSGVTRWAKTPHGVSRVKPQIVAEKKPDKPAGPQPPSLGAEAKLDKPAIPQPRLTLPDRKPDKPAIRQPRPTIPESKSGTRLVLQSRPIVAEKKPDKPPGPQPRPTKGI